MNLIHRFPVALAVSLATMLTGCSDDAGTVDSTSGSQIDHRHEHDRDGAEHDRKGRDEHVRIVKAITSTSGTDRLNHNKVELVDLASKTRPNAKFFDFHSLVWQRLNDGVWIDHLTITKADFQRGGSNRRWVTSLHSFDPTTGFAILEVGEEFPVNANESVAQYTWREWNLNDNTELKIIPLDDKTTIYACPMCEEQRLKKPGTCPICEMQLVPTLGSIPPSDK